MAEYNRIAVQYIRPPMINGTSAMQIEVEQRERIKREKIEKKTKPKHRRIYCFNIEPVSLIGAIAAKVLGTILVFGFMDFLEVQKEYQALENHLIDIQNQNLLAENEFRSKVDLVRVQEMAESFGMIPVSEAEVVTIYIDSSEKAKEEKETIWDRWKWHWDMLWANVPPTKFVEEPADIIPTGPAPSIEDLI